MNENKAFEERELTDAPQERPFFRPYASLPGGMAFPITPSKFTLDPEIERDIVAKDANPPFMSSESASAFLWLMLRMLKHYRPDEPPPLEPDEPPPLEPDEPLVRTRRTVSSELNLPSKKKMKRDRRFKK
jgi:hypothetical protein